MTKIGVFKCAESAQMPEIATSGSACFDVRACFHDTIKAHNSRNQKYEITPSDEGVIYIERGCRALIPTGLIFDIPEGYSLRLHPRSSLAWKLGLTLANAEGVIDSDYINETFIMVYNFTNEIVEIKDHERIAQAELVKNEVCEVIEIDSAPVQKTERAGGFGSTGTH